MEKHELDISMETGDVFAYLVRQQFLGLRGLVNLVMNVIIVLCLVLNWENYDTTARLLLFMLLFLFDIYVPVTMYLRAKSQSGAAKENQTFTHYLVSDEGITVSQGEESIELLWGHFQKYKKSEKRIYVYTSRMTAFIFPKNQIEDSAYEFLLGKLKENKSDFGTKPLNTAKHIVPEENKEVALEESDEANTEV